MTNSIHNKPDSSIDVHQFGGSAPLDLIKGHLRTVDNGNDNPQYINASRGLSFLPEPVGWVVPFDDYDAGKELHFVAKVQPFVSGGFEVVITSQDLHELANNMDRPRVTGKREEGERKENDVITSIQRSKTKVRHLIKSMGMDRLLTLTKRENDPDSFCTLEQWAADWKRFVRLCLKAGVELQYVTVFETHKKGNYHLHAAILGHVNVNVMRGIWWSICGGRGQGNVDIKMKQGCTDHQRRAGLAKYVSKYIVKESGHVEFNKKRYWSSKHKLPAVKRYILNAQDFIGAFYDFCTMMALDVAEVFHASYQFPGANGCWFSFDDKMAAPVPF